MLAVKFEEDNTAPIFKDLDSFLQHVVDTEIDDNK